MLTTEQINDLHRTYWSEHWPIRKIERQLNIGWRTIRKYLDAPAQNPAHRERPSKLDPFKAAISEWIEKDPTVSAAVIEQKLRSVGYDGGHSILREHVRNIRPKAAPRRAFVRMEPIAGERFEVDWGHFGALDYSGDSRKLYAFALVDAHSRMLYVEFTHSQSFQTFARCHIHAFTALGGVAREIAYDNLATAVAEHDGRLVRFLPRFLGFAREYGFVPHACNPASGWEKGKVERAIGYPFLDYPIIAAYNRSCFVVAFNLLLLALAPETRWGSAVQISVAARLHQPIRNAQSPKVTRRNPPGYRYQFQADP